MESAPFDIYPLQEVANAITFAEEIRHSPWPMIAIHVAHHKPPPDGHPPPTMLPTRYRPSYRQMTRFLHGLWKGVLLCAAPSKKKPVPLREVLGMLIEKRMKAGEAESYARFCARALEGSMQHVRRGVPDCHYHGRLITQYIDISEALRIMYKPREGSENVIAYCDKGLKAFREIGGVVDYERRMFDLVN